MSLVYAYSALLLFFLLTIVVTVAAVRRNRVDACESRMRRMMVCCGIDPTGARYADHLLRLDMQDIRSRCRRCPDTRRCDHWLGGEAIAGNDFCPNAEQFVQVAASRTRILRSGGG